MGCNCGKNKIREINQKYGDGNDGDKKVSPLAKILDFMMQIVFGILCGAIIIVMVIPMLIYIVFCLMFGKDASFRIRNLDKYWNNK